MNVFRGIVSLVGVMFSALATFATCTPTDGVERGNITIHHEGELLLGNEGGSVTFDVECDMVWTTQAADPEQSKWLSLWPASGEAGVSEVQIVASANDGDVERTADIIFRSGGATETLTVRQQKTRLDVSAPTLDFGFEGETKYIDVETNLPSWRVPVPSGSEWCRVTRDTGGGRIEIEVENNFGAERRVTFDVVAGSLSREITVTQGSFDSENYYADGEVVKLLGAKKGDGVELVLMGDGYTLADMTRQGGDYEKLMRQTIEHFFSTYPLSDYRDYFNVWMVAAVSGDEGITDSSAGAAGRRDTRLATVWGGGGSTLLECDRTTAEQYARKAADAAGKTLDEVTAIVPVNMTARAGTSWFRSGGFSMAICSTGEAFFQSMILHEVCGHGFAKLADEYTRPGAPDAAMRSNIIAAQRDGIYMNIDVECGGDKTLTKWSGFVGKAGYENVGAFEGAFMFTDGVWRSEEAESCMDDESIHYFNAPSRWMQARRVMALSGEDADFTIDEFIAVDKEKQ